MYAATSTLARPDSGEFRIAALFIGLYALVEHVDCWASQMADSPRSRSATVISMASTTNSACATQYEQKNLEEQTSHDTPLLVFSLSRAVCRHWSSRSGLRPGEDVAHAANGLDVV